MSDATPNLSLPFLAAAQAQKHVTLNEALSMLDGLVAAAAASRSVAVEPASAADGQAFLIPAGASGETWSLKPAGALLRWKDGAWSELPAPVGLRLFIADEGLVIVRTATGWKPLAAALGELQQLTRLGLGATADAATPLLAKLNAALLTARGPGEGGDGDLRLTLNKSASANTASVVLQSAYGGRAEIGLAGDDDLHVKVSADGTTWSEALRVDRASLRVTLPGALAATGATVGTPGDQPYPTTLTLLHGGHPTSRRTSLNLDNAWSVDSDTGADGTLHLGAYNGGLGQYQLILPRAGGLQVGGRPLVDAEGLVRLRTCTRASLPPSTGSGGYAEVTDPAPGKSLLVRDSAPGWRYAGDGSAV